MLDFIGQANRYYNFEEKLRALLANTKHSVDYELKHGFVPVPKGCATGSLRRLPRNISLITSAHPIQEREGLFPGSRVLRRIRGKS